MEIISNEPNEEIKELKRKRAVAVKFIRAIKSESCSLLDGVNCKSCAALDVLRKLGEA